MNNLVPTVLSFLSPRARERETLENTGHVSPRIWEMTNHNLEGRAGKSGVMVRICSPSLYVIFCHLPDSERHVTSVFQGLSLSFAPGDGKERTLGTERGCEHELKTKPTFEFHRRKRVHLSTGDKHSQRSNSFPLRSTEM